MNGGTLTVTAIAFSIASIALRWRFPSVPKSLASAMFVGSIILACGASGLIHSLSTLPEWLLLTSLACNAALLIALIEIWLGLKIRTLTTELDAKSSLNIDERKAIQRAIANEVGNVEVRYQYESALDFSQDLADLFEAYGWKVTLIEGGGWWNLAEASKPIRLLYNGGETSQVKAVKAGLANAAIEFEVKEMANLDTDIEIEVTRHIAKRV